MTKKLKKYSLDEIKDEAIGKKNSKKRMVYEHELQMEIIGELIKKAREERMQSSHSRSLASRLPKSQNFKTRNSAHFAT